MWAVCCRCADGWFTQKWLRAVYSVEQDFTERRQEATSVGYSLRDLGAQSKFGSELKMEAIGRAVPMGVIDAVLARLGVKEERERKFTMRGVVILCIAMSLFKSGSLGAVMENLAKGLRFVWRDPDYEVPKDSAICQRRYQLRARPMIALFREVCRPMATPETPGAFLFGYRLMAIDGTVEDVPDTEENEAAFGRPGSSRGESAFPQVKGVYLVEVGTHAIVDATFWPCRTSERVGAFRVLRSVEEDMLVMGDRGLYEYDMLKAIRKRGAHALFRMPSCVKPRYLGKLPDGSYAAYIYPGDKKRRHHGEHMLVRIIEYRVSDPAFGDPEETYRLVTTLLDWPTSAAYELACAYHERWEIELVIDELDTHQRLAGRPLRSRKPVGVIQELHGLLIGHYAIRYAMHESARQEGIDPDRLSFTRALEVITRAIDEFQMVSCEQQPALYSRILRDIARRRLPERQARSNPRVVKQKMSNFRRKRREDWCPAQPERSFREMIMVVTHEEAPAQEEQAVGSPRVGVAEVVMARSQARARSCQGAPDRHASRQLGRRRLSLI